MNLEEQYLITTTKAACYLGVSPSFLSKARVTGKPEIPYVKIGSRVRYRLHDLESFAAENTRFNTSQSANPQTTHQSHNQSKVEVKGHSKLVENSSLRNGEDK